MNIRIDNIKLNIGESEDKLIKLAAKKLGRPLKCFSIIKKSLDARDKNNIYWVYSVVASDEQVACAPLERIKKCKKAVIVGAGPADRKSVV